MGGKMSCLTRSQSKSAEALSDGGSSSFIKSKSPKRSAPDHDQTRRCKEKQHGHKNLQIQKELVMSRDNSLTLEDSAAGFKNPGRKIHPSSSCSSPSSRQVPRRLISEAKDSMCLDRPMLISNYCKQEENEEEELEEGKSSECLSVCEEEKRVRFKLPHVVILYSPEQEPHGYYCNTRSEDSSFYLTLEENYRGGSFESPDEFCFTLAVNTLPQASFSSGLLSHVGFMLDGQLHHCSEHKEKAHRPTPEAFDKLENDTISRDNGILLLLYRKILIHLLQHFSP